VFNFAKIKARGLSFQLAWDLIMVFLLFFNLFIIVFDFSYFFLRPYYVKYVPQISQIYDQVKGVKPHPLTNKYLITSQQAFNQWPKNNTSLQFKKDIILVKSLSQEIIEKNPFSLSGQSHNLELIVELTEIKLKEEKVFLTNQVVSPTQVLQKFWEFNGKNYKSRLLFFENQISPLLSVNYHRDRRLTGDYVDHFFWIDLPFLIIFFWEFLIRWLFAVRNKTYIKWFLFPLYNWYDILGLIPFLRVFRLFRVISIYVRLIRSDITTVGDDFISRAFRYYSNILTEEISDMVAIRILSEVQDEVRSGASINILLSALEPRRHAIKKMVIEYTKHFVDEESTIEDFRYLLEDSLGEAARKSTSLLLIPGIIKETLMKDIGIAIYDALRETLLTSMSDEKRYNTVGNIVDYVLDDILKGNENSEINQLSQEVIIDVIENMKNAVAVKKWAIPNEEKKEKEAADINANAIVPVK
jgi:hypothetical protein